MRSPSRRTLVVGTFVVVTLATLAAGFATAAGVVAHVEASTSVDADVTTIEPVPDTDRLHVRVRVENPTRADFAFRSAFVQVFDGEAVVADNSGFGFDRTTVPAGESGELTVTVAATGDADAEAVRTAAREDELRAAGRIEGLVIERNFRISIEDSTRE